MPNFVMLEMEYRAPYMPGKAFTSLAAASERSLFICLCVPDGAGECGDSVGLMVT